MEDQPTETGFDFMGGAGAEEEGVVDEPPAESQTSFDFMAQSSTPPPRSITPPSTTTTPPPRSLTPPSIPTSLPIPQVNGVAPKGGRKKKRTVRVGTAREESDALPDPSSIDESSPQPALAQPTPTQPVMLQQPVVDMPDPDPLPTPPQPEPSPPPVPSEPQADIPSYLPKG